MRFRGVGAGPSASVRSAKDRPELLELVKCTGGGRLVSPNLGDEVRVLRMISGCRLLLGELMGEDCCWRWWYKAGSVVRCQRVVFHASCGYLTNLPRLRAGFASVARQVVVVVAVAVVHARQRCVFCHLAMIDGRLLACVASVKLEVGSPVLQ